MSKNKDYTTGNLLDYKYFSNHYKLIATDLTKQIELVSLQNLQQENGMLFTIKNTQYMVKEMKIIQELNLKQKSLNQVFVIIVLVTGNITATGDANTKDAFKNCAQFTRCVTHINDENIDTAANLDIIMSMYNLIEYSDKYSNTSGSLWQFRRYESPVTNARNPENVYTDNSTSFKYK